MDNYILWLASWYPNKLEPFNGDFIQRHAQAVSLIVPITVIHVLEYKKSNEIKENKIEINEKGNLKEVIIWVRFFTTGIKFIDKMLNKFRYYSAYKKYIRAHFMNNGEPDLVHVHVSLKAGVIARWVKKWWRIPYMVSEHWTGYLPEAKEKFSDFTIYYRILWRRVMKEASAISVVSSYLGDCLKKELPRTNFTVIPNVVNTNIFKPVVSEVSKITRFIHISGLDHQKNAEDILKALAILKQNHSDFYLTIIGPHCESLHHLTKELKLEQHVNFHSEMPQDELVKFIQRSQAFIFYSRYETFGCVIIEANACGLPVIASDIKVFHETIKEGVNGTFVQGENPAALAEKLLWFVKNQDKFDRSAIATKARSMYNYETIGRQFTEWYDSVLQKHR